ncbi:MAG: Nif3-like dinuclear metal center hexameric protein [Candidatus Cyclobacteriaceae bacterium M3_2C_046]
MNWILIISLLTWNLGGIMPENPKKEQTANTIVEKIIDQTGCPTKEATVDIIKEGQPQTPVTGIVTTMFATMEVLQEAVDKNCNLIIAHEPLYYNHLDQTTQFENDPVFEQKQQFMRDHQLVVWRFHDYIHCLQPDGILTGMVQKLNWQDHTFKGQLDQFRFENTDLDDLLRHLKNTFPGNAFYVVGNPEMEVNQVHLAPGSPGAARHFEILKNPEVDVLIAGEVPQWETYEYVRDAVAQGRNKAVIFLGHVNSEEAGMAFAAAWMKEFIQDIPIFFVESGPSYWSY